MKVFVAGATGALGRQLLPMLARGGHEVVGMTRTPSKRALLEDLGARPVVADALDPEAVGRAVSEAEPEVIVHQLTAIPASINMRHLDRDFATTNRLRTKGTDHLLSAARAVGARRFVAQSFASYFARSGAAVKGEDDGFDPDPPAAIRSTLAAILHVEEAVTGTAGLEGVVDDEPARVREWLPVAAAVLAAKPPLRLPRWLGRLAAGEAAAVMMTEARGASNAKAKRELGWRLRYPSWRQGFAASLG